MKKKIGMRKVGIRVVEKKKVKPPTNFDTVQSLDFIWDKLHGYRDELIPDCGDSGYDEEWDDICTAMTWIEDECGLERIEGVLERKQPKTKAIKLTGHFPDSDDGDDLLDGLQEYADGVARDILHRNYHKSTNGIWSSAEVIYEDEYGNGNKYWEVSIKYGCQDDTRNEKYEECIFISFPKVLKKYSFGYDNPEAIVERM